MPCLHRKMMDSGRPVPPALVMTSRIIWAALVFGQLVFAVVNHRAATSGRDAIRRTICPSCCWPRIDAAMLFMGIIAKLVVPRLLIDPDADDQTLRGKYTSAMLIPMACLEGKPLRRARVRAPHRPMVALGVVPAYPARATDLFHGRRQTPRMTTAP